MARIVIRLLLCLVIVINLIILALCSVTGVNIYKKYGKEMLIGVSVFAGLVAAFYVSLALLGVTE